MPLSFKPFNELQYADIQRLQNDAVPEGLRIDYKRDNYGPNEGREFLKDASSFANAYGGYLLIGIEEENGVITAIPGVPVATVDHDILRLENLLRDGIEPRMIGSHVRRIEVTDSTAIIALTIPKSMNPPHRVSSQGTNRFYVRNSNGKHETSVEELRHLFGFGARLREEISNFVFGRRAKILTGNDVVADDGEGALIVHVINASTFGDDTFVDVKRLYADPYRFAGPSGGGITRRMTLEGVLVGGEVQGKFWDRTIVFRDGSVETVHSHLYWKPRDQVLVPGLALTQNLLHAVEKSLKGLVVFGGTGPFVIAVAVQASKGMPISFYNHAFNHPTFDRDLVELPMLTLIEYDPSTPAHSVIRPLLDNLWNSVGLPDCGYFQGDTWRPPR